MDYEKVLKHYNDKNVQKQIFRFSKGRWLALQCEEKNEKGEKVFIRYSYRRGKKPLYIQEQNDVNKIINEHIDLKPRTIYVSILRYKKLENTWDVTDPSNTCFPLPTWDIDNERAKYTATIAACRVITNFLKSKGVSRSVIIKWSGNGCHVHLHPKSISEDVYGKMDPLDIAYSVVEYVVEKTRWKIHEVRCKFNAGKLKVENRVNPKAVATSILSLHRDLDSVAVCLNPDQLEDFSLDWTSIEMYKHYPDWDNYITGEADSLVKEAQNKVGGYPHKFKRYRRKTVPLDKWIIHFMRENRGAEK